MPYNINTDIEAQTETQLDDINFVNPSSFKLLIDNMKFKNVQFLVQQAAIPDISIDAAQFNTPMRNIGIAADKVTYSALDCTFLIDENLINYTEIHDWLLAQVTEDDTKKKTRDITLVIYTSHNNVARQIQFVDAYPISLSSVPFDATSSDVEYLTANVSFNYSYYKII